MPRTNVKQRQRGAFDATRRAAKLITQSIARTRNLTYSRGMRSGVSVVRGNLYAPASLHSYNREIKSLDLPLQTIAFTTAGGIIALNLIAPGSSYFNRIGRKIEMKSLNVNGVITLNATTVAGVVRFLIVYDRQANGALPAVQDVIQTTDYLGTNTLNVQSNINLNNRDRFTILRDMRVFIPSATVTAGVVTNPGDTDPVAPTYFMKMFVPLKAMVVQYKSDSATPVIGDIATGSLLFLTIGNTTTGTVQISPEFRLRYTDV